MDAPRIYMDHNATTAMDSRVLDAMMPYFQGEFGNPSSVHWHGQQARRAVDLARKEVGGIINAGIGEIVLTSGGTEANNLALQGTLKPGDHLISSAIEHPAILATCKHLEKQGVDITLVPVDAMGRVTPQVVADAIERRTKLISIMLANNDIGTIQPVADIAAIAAQHGVMVHTDAVQAVGKIPVDVKNLGVDLLSFSAHKLYGPKGVGAVYIRQGVELTSLIHGGQQEFRRRAGTENVAGAVGFGRACQLSEFHLQDADDLAELRDRLWRGLQERIDGIALNGHPEERLPNTLGLSIDGVDGPAVVMNLDLQGIAVSAGSACTSGSIKPSHVLLAMGHTLERATSTVRISLGRGNTTEEVDQLVEALALAIPRLRRVSAKPMVS
jgi:cysteine desulfurase